MRTLLVILLSLLYAAASGQQGFAYSHFTSDDGTGLMSNVVTSIYQDERGFIWVGNANGLQRFDGTKFIRFRSKGKGDPLPYAPITQIIPLDSGKLLLAASSIREFGVFNTSNFEYKRIKMATSKSLAARAEFWVWKDSKGKVYLNVSNLGILRFNPANNTFVEHNDFKLPKGWLVNNLGVHEDASNQQVYFATDSGLCIYDRKTNQSWYKGYNPKNLKILSHPLLADNLTQVYLDKKERLWVFGWQTWNGGPQSKLCFSKDGSVLSSDTLGLQTGPNGYTEYNHLFETSQGDLWIYGLNILMSYDNNGKRFQYYPKAGISNVGIDYENVYQVMQDKDGSLWIATDRGLYYTAYGNGAFSVVNFAFKDQTETTNITDILELPNGDWWLTSWGNGIKSLNSSFKRIENDVYKTAPPANWPASAKGAIKLTWSMCRQSTTGKIFIGCNSGVLLVYDPAKKKTEYLLAPEFNGSTIRFITEDKYGQIWLSTQGGRLIKWANGRFTVVQDIGSIIYKIFIDSRGWLWLSTHEKGFYAVHPYDGRIIQHYTAGDTKQSLYSNTGSDIEQLNDSIIVLGAGALHFINVKRKTVEQFSYEDGLSSNSVKRLRMDSRGFLWIITSNGLCRYNPNNRRITSYGRRDGVVLAEQTDAADYLCSQGYLLFGGGNSVLMFDPKVFTSTQRPPNVTITDFKIFNEYHLVDSLLQHKQIKLEHTQNSISIYFSALSFRQKDKLTYYYKLEGIDKHWIRVEKSNYVNYSQLPPGDYVFKVYCEDIEGFRSAETTEIQMSILPPFWRSGWFLSCILFVIALLIYAVHDLRVNKLLAVEKVRNKVARDLHDDMGSTLSTINILSSMAKTKMSVDVVKTSEYLSKISDNSQRMMEAMDDIVWSIKPSNDSMNKITARMREFATNVLEAKDIDFLFEVDENVHDIKLNMEGRRDYFLIFKEAVNNAAKYSRASRVWVKISVNNKKMTMLVKDDGIGFDVNNSDGNGLGNMRKRADAMNGTLSIQSKEAMGTTVQLVIPV